MQYHRPAWLTDYQRAFLYNPERYTIVEAATKTGKTQSMLVWLLEKSLAKGGIWWWVAPVYNQAKIAYRRMKTMLVQSFPPGSYKCNDSSLEIVLFGGHALIQFKSGEKADNLYGEDVDGTVVDEATRMRPESWDAIRSTLTATRGPAKIISNVKGNKNWVTRLRAKAATHPDYAYFKVPFMLSVEAGINPMSEYEDARESMSEALFRELYDCEPRLDGDNPFGLQHIAAAQVGELSKLPAICYGVDLARSRDFTVIFGLDRNGQQCYFDRFQHDWELQFQHLTATIGNTPAIVDQTGLGDVVLSRLQTACPRVQGIKFTNASKQKMMQDLAFALQTGKMKYYSQELRDELDVFEYKAAGSTIRYEAAKGFHDDCVCAAALAWQAFSEQSKFAKGIYMDFAIG